MNGFETIIFGVTVISMVVIWMSLARWLQRLHKRFFHWYFDGKTQLTLAEQMRGNLVNAGLLLPMFLLMMVVLWGLARIYQVVGMVVDWLQ